MREIQGLWNMNASLQAFTNYTLLGLPNSNVKTRKLIHCCNHDPYF